MSMGIAIGMGTNKRYVHRRLPKIEVWCGYARIVIIFRGTPREERRTLNGEVKNRNDRWDATYLRDERPFVFCRRAIVSISMETE